MSVDDLLGAYLASKTDYANEITEAIIFLDHLIRETPSTKFTQIKKSFKGVFSSMIVAIGPANKPCLTVMVDVTNGTFFHETKLQDVVPSLDC